MGEGSIILIACEETFDIIFYIVISYFIVHMAGIYVVINKGKIHCTYVGGFLILVNK